MRAGGRQRVPSGNYERGRRMYCSSKTEAVASERIQADIQRTRRNLFLLRTHPDLFGNEPHQGMVNQKSLKTLNFLLATIKDGKSLGDEAYDLHFFCRTDDTVREARVQFIPRDHMTQPLGTPDDGLARGLEMCIERLYVLAGVVPAPSAAEPEEPSDAADEDLNYRGWSSFRWITDTRKYLIDKLRLMPGDIPVPAEAEARLLIRHELIFYRNLTTAQQRAAVHRLLRSARAVKLERWKDVPILFSRKFARDVEGFVAIPYNFQLGNLQAYLAEHLPAIMKERQLLRQQAQVLIDVTENLQRVLSVRDVSVLGPKLEALPCLQRLLSLSSQLRLYDWRHTNLVIHAPLIEPSPQKLGAETDTKQRSSSTFSFDQRLRRLYIPQTFDSAQLLQFLQSTHAKNAAWPWKQPLLPPVSV